MWLHRVVGLALAAFLIAASLTGSVITFRKELDAWLNPALDRVEPPAVDAVPIDVLELRDRMQSRVPDASFDYVELDADPGEVQVFHATFDQADDEHAHSRDDEFFVDPYTGELLGSRRWGRVPQAASELVPYVYRLHYTLGLGEVGRVLLGLVALLWTLDCFVGAYLTFPPRRSEPRTTKDWMKSWSRAWRIKTTGLFAVVFTWHRAAGLWLWSVLFVFAWSAVALNLERVYSPVMGSLFATSDVYEHLPRLDAPEPEPSLSFADARAAGRAAMASKARSAVFEIHDEVSMAYAPRAGLYVYKVRSSRDVSVSHPNTIAWIDASSGEAVAFFVPTGEASGDTVTTWLTALHFGAIAFRGDPGRASLGYRLLVVIIGIVIAGLSVTGVWIWWRKRGIRLRASKRDQTTPSGD